jgi:nicotinate-nucleotide adenylyltransferase
MVEISIGISENMFANDMEFKMKKPSYTCDTLKNLKKENTNIDYVLIIGSDNIKTFNLWKEYGYILENFEIYAYERIGYTDYDKTFVDENNITIMHNCPSLELSSTFIRKALSEGKNMNYFLPPGVNHHIQKNELYK